MSQRSMSPTLVIGLVLAGLALLAIGWNWDAFVPSSTYWGPEQAQELVDAHADLHAKSHIHDSQRRDEEFAAARDRLARIQRELDSARDNRVRTGTIVSVLGVVLLLAGIVLHFIVKQPE